ncbi:MAG: DUF2135 domain-containing protein [Candidatus Riflebacteria bacterium]|nr:DUF2135 domain-containing protein [Candidatus Riflebacteria bacterium]
MRKYLLIVFFMALASVVCAQIPEIVVKKAGEEPVKLADLEMRVRIFGHLAETTMTMKFYNPNSRVLEGELEFPMPEGAIVSGYALDVNGDLVEGVAVEKQKAREIFETEVRRGVDPGLVEKVKGNNFKTRVYPLNPRSNRTVQVTYLTELAIDDASTRYRVPLQLSRATDRFNLRVEVLSADESPKIQIQGLQPTEFNRMQSGWFSEITVNKQEIKSELVVDVPMPKSGSVVVEKSADGQYYFSVQGVIANRNKSETKPASRIAVIYDASGSAAKRDLELEKKFITALLASDRVADKFEVEFVEFRNKPGVATSFSVERGNAAALIKHIENVKFDGGTSFTGLADNLKKPDFYLLLSDGLNTFGKAVLPELNAPLYAVTGADGADYGFLQMICRSSGGAMINLKNTELERAVKLVGAEFFGLVNRQAGAGIAEIYPAGVVPVHPHFMLAGVLDRDETDLLLQFGSHNSERIDRKFTIKKSAAVTGEFLRKYWAARKIDELLAQKDKNRSEIVALSKKHSIVNEFTSLLVLETIGQYLEHRVVPPASKPEWRQQYFAVLEKEAAEIATTRDSKLETVVNIWNERLKWWNTDFTKVELQKNDKKGRALLPPVRSVQPMHAPGSVAPAPAMDSESFSSREEMSDEVMPALESRRQESGGAGSAEPQPSVVGGVSSKSMSENKESDSRPVNPGVVIKPWQPDTLYVKKIKAAKEPYSAYLEEKPEYMMSPAFYLDCADVFLDLKMNDIALQVLSNIAELELENPALMRILAHRLSQIDELEISAAIFSEVLEMRGEEPQSYRDLALVLGRSGEYQRAVELLYEVVLKKWDGRFPEIEVIALEEMNNLIVQGKRSGIKDFKVDERLVKPIDVDLRIVMTWDADQTDMDLWVIEPSGEQAYYSNPRTQIGGLVSRDFTQGYGPEEYMIKKARHGMYEVKTNFYGSRSQKIAGAVTLQVDLFTNFGRESEKRRSVTLRLTDNKETFKVADIEF